MKNANEKFIRIGDASSKHLFDLVVSFGHGTGKFNIEVDADDRSESRKVAENQGYLVHSVNMVG